MMGIRGSMDTGRPPTNTILYDDLQEHEEMKAVIAIMYKIVENMDLEECDPDIAKVLHRVDELKMNGKGIILPTSITTQD